MATVSVIAAILIEETAFVSGQLDHVVVGRHMIAIIWEEIPVFIVVIVNGIMHGLLLLQYVLQNIRDVHQETTVGEFIMIFASKENL